MWQNYFIKKHDCEKVSKDEDKGDFKKNGIHYEYKGSGYNQDNAVNMVQIRLRHSPILLLTKKSKNSQVQIY